MLVAVGTGLWMLPKPRPAAGDTDFEPFDEARLTQAREDGRVVLVKVTAAWCLECKVIDHRIYKNPDIADELRRRGVLALTADVTDRSDPASKWLRAAIGGAPPITLVYPPGDGEPLRIDGSFSRDDLLRMLDQAGAIGS